MCRLRGARGLLACSKYMYMIEFGLQAKLANLYRGIVCFAAARDNYIFYYQQNYKHIFIIGGFVFIYFAAMNPLMWTFWGAR